MGTALGTSSPSANRGFHPNALVARERVQNPDHFKLLFPLRIMYRRDIHAIIELFLVAQNLQQLGDKGRIRNDIFLIEIGNGLPEA